MFAIAITDNDWFKHIHAATYSTVNFWTPTPWAIRALRPGDRWYFMRKAPIRRIGGYGLFRTYKEMTVSDAWKAFGPHNGCNRFDELLDKVRSYSEKRSSSAALQKNPLIGCLELEDVITVDARNHIDPAICGLSFPNPIVKYKTFSIADPMETLFP